MLENGATTHKLVNVPNAELANWDANHDVVGKQRDNGTFQDSASDREHGVGHEAVNVNKKG